MVKILLPISLVVLVVILTAYYFRLNSKTTTQPKTQTYSQKQSSIPTQNPVSSPSATPATKLFRSSKTMKFTIEIPTDYTAVEKFASVTITTPSGGTIYIATNGTNFDNIDDFIRDWEIKNESILNNKTNLNIHGLSAISTKDTKEKDYFIYTKYNVYLIYTKNGDLYSELDQIAQSFKYTP